MGNVVSHTKVDRAVFIDLAQVFAKVAEYAFFLICLFLFSFVLIRLFIWS
jgi:hypothetical protein